MAIVMGARLDELYARGVLSRAQAEAGAQWAGDLATAQAPSIARATLDRVDCSHGGGNVMRSAASSRLGKASARLGGRDTALYRACYGVAYLERSAAELGLQLRMKPSDIMGLVRAGLSELCIVYQVSGPVDTLSAAV